jgi:hypothetical protein
MSPEESKKLLEGVQRAVVRGTPLYEHFFDTYLGDPLSPTFGDSVESDLRARTLYTRLAEKGPDALDAANARIDAALAKVDARVANQKYYAVPTEPGLYDFDPDGGFTFSPEQDSFDFGDLNDPGDATPTKPTCLDCGVELSKTMDAFYGPPDSYEAGQCIKCRGRK